MGIGISTMRELPRYQQDILIRPEKLRPGAEKMQLRQWEEDMMELASTRACHPPVRSAPLSPLNSLGFLRAMLPGYAGVHGQRQRVQPGPASGMDVWRSSGFRIRNL
jgi:hypothetical protein